MTYRFSYKFNDLDNKDKKNDSLIIPAVAHTNVGPEDDGDDDDANDYCNINENTSNINSILNSLNNFKIENSSKNVSNLINKISCKKTKKKQQQTLKSSVVPVVPVLPVLNNCNNNNKEQKIFIHTNFMDTIELAYLLDFYVNENNKNINNFCCFLFGTRKIKENSKSVKSIVIPNDYIRKFKFNLVEIVKSLTCYITSMYKCYGTYELIGWMCASSKSGFLFYTSPIYPFLR
jgi:hypothetical protein